MNRSDLSKVVGAGFLAASLAVVPLALPASAQDRTDTTPRSDTNTYTTPRSDVGDTDTENDTDWGWLGLLGLLGLAGLARKREEPTRYSEVNRDNEPAPRSSTYTR